VCKKVVIIHNSKPYLTSIRGDMWDVSKKNSYYTQPKPYLTSVRGDMWDVSKKNVIIHNQNHI